MWASSRMGLRGSRVSLARTATRKIALKFNFRRLKLHRAIVMLNTAPPPPTPSRKGALLHYVDYTGVCRLTGYGFWSLSLSMVYNFMPVFPNRVWSVRATFHFGFLS